jgi:hypothetical protein
MTSSIRKQLLVWLLIPLSTIAASSTFIAYNAAILLAREIYDKGLLNSADSVIARVRHKGGKVLVDLPPAAQSILKHNYRDTFFYQIYTMDGKRIAGDGTLPFDRGAVDFDKPHYSTRPVTLQTKRQTLMTTTIQSRKRLFLKLPKPAMHGEKSSHT